VFPELRTTETIAGLEAAEAAAVIDSEDTYILKCAWQFASNLRDALVLFTGRTKGAHTDVLPADRATLSGVGRVLKYPVGEASTVEEEYLRAARRARKVMERLFYGEEN
jgi:glutamate-ammonia-ligase adenylyltransferase